ncbi:MAG TPA: ATP-dependent DNA helicase RecG [Spirochaetia bacterium]|nr:ATP-dependent DNA helicase RecG [Spirochaetia bacterium]
MGSALRQAPVQYVKMVGPRRSQVLARLSICSVWDLLYHFPRRHEDRTALQPVHTLSHGNVAAISGTVLGVEEKKPRRGLTVTTAALSDGLTTFSAVWFNQPYVARQMIPGAKLIITGRVSRTNGLVQVQAADYEVLGEGETLHTGRIVPIYPLTAGLSQRNLRLVMKSALDTLSGRLQEFLPAAILDRYGLTPLPGAMSEIHFPSTAEGLERARRRFVFEELFLLELGLLHKRKSIVQRARGFAMRPDGPLIGGFLERLPFSLTGAQKRSWEEIAGEMEDDKPMYRLLQGEVGSGKTVVAELALLKAVENGLQGALLAPTEILAEQHYLSLKKDLSPLGVKLDLYTGSTPRPRRQEILTGLATGGLQVAVGTHALLQEGVVFRRLGIAVIDEQHRFGVRQRAVMQEKGQRPDVLVMTATPIPRTLALTLYGDLSVTTIDELPPHRQPVKTYRAGRRNLGRVYQRVCEEVIAGHQAFVVCPLIEESEQMEDVQAAVDLHGHLQKGPLKNLRLGLLHGRLQAGEKEAVMAAFRENRLDVLVSTTVVEVGVDVPNATAMVILDAERFGLAQLHQLRGRVGRGPAPAICILVSGSRSTEACLRLTAMEKTADGFRLAEEDLKIRGPGEVWGTRQSGLPVFKIADLTADFRLLELARQEAENLLTGDPELRASGHMALREEVQARFAGMRSYIDVG